MLGFYGAAQAPQAMTPTQLRCFVTVVRQGSVSGAARELEVTEAAVSGNMAALRKEFDDRLFSPSRNGLVFTPAGLRLAQRSVEMLGLQEQTKREVDSARAGRRLLRIAATSLFAEYGAPGLIELFSKRADDLEVELMVQPSTRFEDLLVSHGVDVAIGPKSSRALPNRLFSKEFLRYDVVAVAAPSFEYDDLALVPWFLGPSAVEPLGVSQFILERTGVGSTNQRIYTSHARAIDEARDAHGIALAPRFAVGEALDQGTLVEIDERSCRASGMWSATTLEGERAPDVAREIQRFVANPRAIQAMLKGAGSDVARFQPRVHITLWS